MKRLKRFISKKNVARDQKVEEGHLPFDSLKQRIILMIFIIIFVLSAITLMINWVLGIRDDMALKKQQSKLQEEMQIAKDQLVDPDNMTKYEMLPEYKALYDQNNDYAGWLRIEDTVIYYPVMQNWEDENYYLEKDFYKEKNKNGSLILDNDSYVGVGTKEQGYAKGSSPTTNLIIHGHTMKSGLMFGDLMKYENKEYGMAHNIICFDSPYEKRKYELIAVFYSQVYYQSDDVFKFYNFFEADTQEEFDDWYNNIKELSLYDTGVTAEYGDEFITLSCCSYHVEDGRFAVVGKRIYE